MASTGNQPPSTLPARALYLFKDLQRNAIYFNLPKIQRPNDFPVNTLQPMRLLTYLHEQKQRDKVISLSRTFWQYYWEDGINISLPENMIKACCAVGYSTEEATSLVNEKANDPKVKARLKEVTDEAVSRGAFGSPILFVRRPGDDSDEMYFGSDRFCLIAQQLKVPWVGPNPPNTGSAKL